MYLVVILLVIILIGVLYVIVSYNKLISLSNNREQAFSDIDVQLKQRYDLVPNLVNIVKGYATHEEGVFEEIACIRSSALTANSIDEKIAAENQFTSSLKSIFALKESYPELKANQNFLQLQSQLDDIENKIAAARRFFNNATREYNTVLMSFPINILNNIFHFKNGTFFDLGNNQDQVRENVDIKFN